MNSQMQDPIFESLDRLAATADNDVVSDRMPAIQRRVRVSRQRKSAGVVTAMAVLAVGGVGVWHGLPADHAAPPVHQPIISPSQKVTVNAEPQGANHLRISYTITGKSTAYTDPANGKPLQYAGPRNTTVLVDGKVATGSDGGSLSCERGGKLTPYTMDFGKQEPILVTVTPGRHTVAVKAPFCADGVLTQSRGSVVVTTADSGSTVFDTLRADLDGDGTDEVVRILVPRDVDADQQLQVTWGTGETTSASFPNTMETSLLDPVDLDQDGELELIMRGGGGDVAVYSVYLADPGKLSKVTTVDAGGKELSLVSGSDPAEWQTYAGPDGIASYRLTDPTATNPPFPVDVRKWTLAGSTLTQSATNESACVVFSPEFVLGPC